MATAATAQRPASERELVFCHVCREEWYRDTHGLICTRCGSDFVEIIENDHDPLAELLGFDTHESEDEQPRHRPTSPGGTTFVSVEGPGFTFVSSRTFSPGASPHPREGLVRADSDMIVNLFSNIIQNIVGDQNMPRTPGTERQSQEGGHDHGHGPQSPDRTGQEHHGEARHTSPPLFPFGPGPRLAPRDANSPQATPGEPHVIDLPTFLASFLPGAATPGGEAGPPPLGPAFLSHIFPMGPRGDYAYSQQELDRIITQLMEQHQGNAPPPAPEEAIDSLPRVKVTEEQAIDGVDCAVCKDDLNVEEEVCQLPCKHIYHFECVKKWLEVHNTCPICRSPISENKPQDEQHAQRQQQTGPSSPRVETGPSQNQGGSQQPDNGGHAWSRSWSTSFTLGGSGHDHSHNHDRDDNRGHDNGSGNNNQSRGTFAHLFRRSGSN